MQTPYSNLYTAYAQYLHKDNELMEDLIYSLIKDAHAEPQSIVWKWLEMTGDKEYSRHTFIKVARHIRKEQK